MQSSSHFPSEIPQVDLLLESLESRHEDGFALEIIHRGLEELDGVFGHLLGVHLNELQFLAIDDPQNEGAESVTEQFTLLKSKLSELHQHCNPEGLEELPTIALELKNQTGVLFSRFATMREQAKSGEQYCKAPFTQELLRVTHHYLNRHLALAAVQERIDSFCHYHEQLETQILQIVPSESESEVFESSQEELEEALSAQLHGIELLDGGLDNRDEESILEAIELLAEAGNSLFEIYERLRNADLSPRTSACFRCGTENPVDAKLCGGCSAVLPRSEGSFSTTTIELKESGPGEGTSAVSEEYLKMERAVLHFEASGESADLLRVLAVYRRRWEANRMMLERMDAPPASIPADHRQLLADSKQAFQEALDQIGKGLGLLDEGAGSGEFNLMQRGLSEVQIGFEMFEDFQRCYREAESISKN